MFKPMLACTVTKLDKIRFPVYCSPKIDGIRCIILNGKVLSRSFKPIPNKFIQKELSSFPVDLDGELYIKGKSFNDISSAVMSEDGEPDFEYIVFDCISDKPYYQRLECNFYSNRIKFLERIYIETLEKILELEEKYLSAGYEGLMIRDPNGPYKYGRSTEKEGYLMKLKRFEDSEAIILEIIPEFENKNIIKINELGYNKRSSHKANKFQKEITGALLVKDIKSGIEFKVSSGLDWLLKKHIWENKENILGKIIKYKYMPILKEKPRHPTFIGFRDIKDM